MAGDRISYCDVAIVGAGTAGLAAFRAARSSGVSAVLIGRPPFGTTCARVGCMPSKVLLGIAKKKKAAQGLQGFTSDKGFTLALDTAAIMRDVREKRDHFVQSVIDGMDDFGDDAFIEGAAQLLDEHRIAITQPDGAHLSVTANKIIIATGSSPVVLPGFEDQPRVITTDDLFELERLPASIVIVGDGAIALECAFALNALGTDVTLLGHGGPVGGLSESEVGEAAASALMDGITFVPEQSDLALVDANSDGVTVDYNAAGERLTKQADMVLLAVGRTPNFDGLGLDALDLATDADGHIQIDPFTGQTSKRHIAIAGDATGTDTILHVASSEGEHVGTNASRDDARAVSAQPSLRIVFTEPGIAVVGATKASLDDQNRAYVTGSVDFSEQGRAMAEGRNAGRLNVYACAKTGALLGAEMVAPDAEHLAHLIAAGLQARWTIADFLAMPFYHPTVEEGLRTALRDAQHKLRYATAPLNQSLDIAAGC